MCISVWTDYLSGHRVRCIGSLLVWLILTFPSIWLGEYYIVMWPNVRIRVIFFRGVTVHLPENCVKVPKCLRKRTVGSNFSILVFNSAHNYWSLSVSFSEKTENEMIKIQAALQNFSDSDLLPELFAATRKYVIKLKLKVLKPFLPLPANTAISVTGPYR